jgi:4-alpha-glucanotransferase
VYTGTHDNDTTLGWWKTATEYERGMAEQYTGTAPGESPVWPMIRTAATSLAEISIAPAQDLLELGSEARMNKPAVAAGNWNWRAPEQAWKPALAARLAALAEATDRDCDPLGLLDMNRERAGQPAGFVDV